MYALTLTETSSEVTKNDVTRAQLHKHLLKVGVTNYHDKLKLKSSKLDQQSNGRNNRNSGSNSNSIWNSIMTATFAVAEV